MLELLGEGDLGPLRGVGDALQRDPVDDSITVPVPAYVPVAALERVLGVDMPDLFPIEQPPVLRHLYLAVARRTGQEISQVDLADEANAERCAKGTFHTFVVDVRTPEEFAGGHVDGAVNLPANVKNVTDDDKRSCEFAVTIKHSSDLDCLPNL